MTIFAKISLDHSIGRILDYEIPKSLEGEALPGRRVLVPVKSSQRKGTILSVEASTEAPYALPISEVLEEADALPQDLLKMANFMSEYYATPLDKALSCILPSSVKRGTKEKTQIWIQSVLSQPKLIEYTSSIRSRYPKQACVLDIMLKNPKGIFLTKLLEDVSKSAIDTLIKKDILAKKDAVIDRSTFSEGSYFPTKPKTLTDEQHKAFTEIESSLEEGGFSTHLIYGVTGSGKTEIYLQAIQKALDQDKGVILLVPEIALTGQTIDRLKSRLQQKIAVLHYRLSHGERMDTWHSIRRGQIRIVVGARSAIFSPVPNLGLIIVDEEQESSYKQIDEMPCYHARDMAIFRGNLTNSTVILGSATPSLESFYHAKNGKYQLHTLTKRATGASRAKICVVNMRDEWEKEKQFALFSQLLRQKIQERLERGEQSILFLNRRGYYSAQICSECSSAVTCKHCAVNLTYHKKSDILSCHICGFQQKSATFCPTCKTETMAFKGPGTEQVERVLQAIFPGIRTLRMDRDTTKHKGSHEKILDQFRAQKADLLIGTQMIAKGLHFPHVTLVGVIYADSSLHIPDFRAQESVFQLLTQVSGRSGREFLQGEVVIQSLMPDHPIIELAKKEDFDNFFQKELSDRKAFFYPPYVRLIKVVFSSKNLQKASNKAFQTYKLLQKSISPQELQPVTPCGYPKIKDRHRFQFLIKTHHVRRCAALLKKHLSKKDKSVHVHIDVDPTSTFS